ncbi:uncharacterized protein A1O5_04778 [Cladophialophora psammophila CBS 110553]|uniref:AAA+ ATPase domain-containing protein n=1 Tax=Cladophialophora psammophila CBS 110553 TaxID=1182543 RepID=W9XPK9_9EURO|nr:uncharacterized protein A1O5_04778 [Cladophialophora psammophila CBS 110553]EXJ72274.1 hypothetical protein A1O5_04778 [Cladophialophora psammophila CBS 110553]
MAPSPERTEGIPSLTGPAAGPIDAQGDSVHTQPGEKIEENNINEQADDQNHDHGEDQATGAPPDTATTASPLFLEIRALQERLSQLQQQAIHEQNVNGQHFADDERTEAPDASEEKRLRKQIRRARSAKKWVKDTEAHAETTADSRTKYAYTGPFMHSFSTEYGVEDQGKCAIFDFATMDEYFAWTLSDFNKYRRDDTMQKPHRAIRPLASLRPIYSRKLGPPNQWDTSDSEEWSDGSTRSRDFDYFRARLRGDFEWELDRLNAQRSRYLKHKEKKAAQYKQEQMREDAKKIQEAMAQRKIPSDDGTLASTIPPQGKMLVTLNRVDWEAFRAHRFFQESPFAIDILTEEPKISANPWRISKSSILASKVQDVSAINPEGGQGPLPERIRIHSKELIMILSRIHGSKLITDQEEQSENTSLVLLRPFKMLRYYDKEIREWHLKLLRDHEAAQLDTEGLPTTTGPPDPDEAVKAVEGQQSSDPQSMGKDKSGVEDPDGYSTSSTALEHLACLLEFMDKYLYSKHAYLNSVGCDRISFSDIWHLFKPGDIVVSNDGKQAYLVANIFTPPHKGADRWSFYTREKDDEESRGKSDISVSCVYIHYDGRQLGPVLEKFTIRRFDGERPLNTLEILPLRLYVARNLRGPTQMAKFEASGENEAQVETGVARLRESLIERGRKFVEVAGVKHMYYAGLTVDTRDEIESQVVIDFEEALGSEKNREKWLPEITPLVGLAADLTENQDSSSCTAECCWQENVHNDSYVENHRCKKFISDMMDEIEDNPRKLPSVAIYPRPLEDTKTDENKLKDEELLIMSYRVFGFALRDRTWAQLDLSNLTPVNTSAVKDDMNEDDDPDDDESDKTAFGRLVLPRGHKKMVLSLIAQHFRNKESQQDKDEQADIVRGKGKGLIILLHGAPGVGKTTTAEGVAERFRKPLFQITCGDLGSNAEQVETALQTNFALANRWGCILLLDEADVFLAERRHQDFTRNGLVAVFLRVLEYYAGILFLTTNRIGDFDEAFVSRIHMSLHYPPLNSVSTIKVVKLNLDLIKERYEKRDKKIKIEEFEILEKVGEYFRTYEDARWNGRQIRNACQTALALAEFDAQPSNKKYDLKAQYGTKVVLRASHLDVVSKAYLEFMRYLKEVHGADADTRAKESGLRALESVIAAINMGKGRGAKSSERDGDNESRHLDNFRLQRRPQTQTLGSPSSQPDES